MESVLLSMATQSGFWLLGFGIEMAVGGELVPVVKHSVLDAKLHKQDANC